MYIPEVRRSASALTTAALPGSLLASAIQPVYTYILKEHRGELI